ncbi:hypothetical protein [Reticulibacter mediterranei]|nr:hypothetical protein [Reticulibacter mediterranei]
MEFHKKNANAAADVPVVSLAASDRAALAEMIRAFLVAMRQKPVPTSASDAALCQVAFERLEHLQQRLGSENEGHLLALRLEDIQSLEGALLLFAIFLHLEVPSSEKRATVLESLWDLRDQLAQLRRDRFHLN